MNTIIDKLNDLAWKADTQINDLNSGGCAVFAYEVAKKLKEQGIDAVGVVAMSSFSLDDDWPNVSDVRNRLYDVSDAEEWYDNGVIFSHVGVEFELDGMKYHYDSSGVQPVQPWLNRQDWKVLDGRLEIDDLKALADVPSNWNTWFNRNQIPKMQQLVKYTLS